MCPGQRPCDPLLRIQAAIRYARVAIRPRESRSRLGQVTVAAAAPRVDPSLILGVPIGYGVGMSPETLTKPTGRIHAVDALRGFAMAVAVLNRTLAVGRPSSVRTLAVAT